MSSLRARIVALIALVALLSTAVCAVAASRVLRGGVDQLERARLQEEADEARLRLRELCDVLVSETADCAAWDDLHQRMPRPSPAWSATHLRPGAQTGRLTQAFILIDDGEIIARCRGGEVRDHRAGDGDPAHARALAPVVVLDRAASGVGVFAGAPALWALHPILPSDGTGAARGALLGLAYLDEAVLARMCQPDWRLTMTPIADQKRVAGVRLGDDLGIAFTVDAVDGVLMANLQPAAQLGPLLAIESQVAIIGAGLITAIVALLLGAWLGMAWLRPIHALAEACRARALDSDHPLPESTGLSEADVLASSLASLIESERASREQVSTALTRETTTNAVHRRFLAQLGQELGDPIRRLIDAIASLDAHGRLDPAHADRARAAAQALEVRFQEALGLASGFATSHGSLPAQSRLDEFIASLAQLLEPLARQRGVTLAVDAPGEAAALDRRLLAPVMVNLASNAIKASTGGTVTLRARIDGHDLRLSVSDQGSGLPDELAQRVAAACRRGEVLPGEPGIGLGLALALANTRAMGGELTLATTGPQGSRFDLRMPMQTPTGMWRRQK
ncbi:MAG TPA: ATP-binding protein [Planctomycetota bacterium]|nr:ATP-binding protein [Planctomycetota bacterium]